MYQSFGANKIIMKLDQNVITFNTKSNDYESARPVYPRELFEFLKRECYSTETAWDCACGTGQVSKSLVNYFNKVYASDINENQILNSFKSESVNFSVQKAEETTFSDSFFDTVCVAQAMHWFNLEKYFREVKRVLKTGGVFACWGYSFFKIEPDIDKVVKEILLDPIKPYWSSRNKILWDKYKDVTFPFKHIQTPEIEMNQIWTKSQLLDYVKTWSAYKRYMEDSSIDIGNIFMEKTRDIWPVDKERNVKMDFSLYLGRNE